LEITDSATASRHLLNISDPALLKAGPSSFETKKKICHPIFFTGQRLNQYIFHAG
jgi:hypothetical protein